MGNLNLCLLDPIYILTTEYVYTHACRTTWSTFSLCMHSLCHTCFDLFTVSPHPSPSPRPFHFKPISWRSLAALFLAGGGVLWYVRKVKAEKDEGEVLSLCVSTN